MRDGDIRGALSLRLHEEYGGDPDTLVRHELGVCEGRRRVDVAVVNGLLTGYEIKSDHDTFVRLSGQIRAYNDVLDRCWLVTTERHLERALSKLPSSWGIILASMPAQVVEPMPYVPKLRTVRRSRLNRTQDPMAVAQLLWRVEAMDELRARGLARGLSKKARWYVWERLVENVSLRELQKIVRERLKARCEWPGDLGRALDDAKIHTKAIE